MRVVIFFLISMINLGDKVIILNKEDLKVYNENCLTHWNIFSSLESKYDIIKEVVYPCQVVIESQVLCNIYRRAIRQKIY